MNFLFLTFHGVPGHDPEYKYSFLSEGGEEYEVKDLKLQYRENLSDSSESIGYSVFDSVSDSSYSSAEGTQFSGKFSAPDSDPPSKTDAGKFLNNKLIG